MKYIQNNGRYALSFEITKDNRQVKIVLDRKRIFRDTGNIATTGITAVADEDYEKLCEYKRFNQLMKAEELELTDITKLETAETEITALKEANKKLEEELAKEKSKSNKKEVDAKMKAKDDEIASLKATLESLTANKEASESKDETEGF